MSEALNLFSIKIYKDFYPYTREIKENLFPKLQSTFEETKDNNNVFMQDGTLCSYHTESYIHQRFPDETKQVMDFIEGCAKKYWKECNYYETLEPFVYQMWANQTPKGGWIQSHLHGNTVFTGVLYIDASPDQGNLILENPLDTILMNQPIGPNVRYPLIEEIKVNTGDLIMFPGFLKHNVKPNTTDTPRLILAFNVGCRGNYWSQQWVRNV